jgi:hypothetical protein
VTTILLVQICPRIANRSTSTGDIAFSLSLFTLLCFLSLSSLFSLYHVLTLFFCDNSDEENEEDNDIHVGDDGDDAMSIASSAMHSVTSSMSKEQLEVMVTNMFEALMKKTTTAVAPIPQTPKRRTTAAAAGGAAGDEPPAPSPQKAAFLLEHDRVVQGTDEMCKAIQKLHQKELWWVQQWVNEAKLKYKTKTIRTYTDNVHRYNIKQAAGMRVMTRTAA